MNIPTAEEARKAIEQGKYEKAKSQEFQVEGQIKEAIGKGLNHISGDGWLEPSVCVRLERLGYKYETGTQYNDHYWCIGW